MKLGVNWLTPPTLPVISELLASGQVDFCEIMVDNFIHLPPADILKTLNGVPCSLHIVASRFLEKSPSEVAALAAYLKPWIHDLQPLYVSDHIIQFTQAGQRTPLVMEWDYEQHDNFLIERIVLWQSLLDATLYFENHASVTELGKSQPAFFQRLLTETNAGLLFDISNAYIADKNNIAPLSAWQAMLPAVDHFHVAGFQVEPQSGLMIDTHDVRLDEAVHSLLPSYLSENKTVVLEYDVTATLADWQHDIQRIRACNL